MPRCESECGYEGVRLECHYRWSPHCRLPPPPAAPASKKRKRDPSASAALFRNRLATSIGNTMTRMHVDQYMKLTDLETVRGLLVASTELVTAFIHAELIAMDMDPGPDMFQTVRRAFAGLPNAGTMVEHRRRVFMRAIPRHLSTGISKSVDERGAVFFSAHNLVTIMLQESAAVRKETIQSSEKWKTGELYKSRPSVLSDVIHGTRFTDWHAVCGKATAAEAQDLRVVLHKWTDEMTPIDGLSQKARVHKYGVCLATLVNLSLRVRHYVDHVLLLAIYNSRWRPRPPALTPTRASAIAPTAIAPPSLALALASTRVSAALVSATSAPAIASTAVAPTPPALPSFTR